MQTYELTVKQCRLMQAKGYTRYELYCLGFDQSTIEKAMPRPQKKSPKSRCRGCGAKVFYLAPGNDCLRCELENKHGTDR